MNDSALQWLTDRASPPGTLAGGLRRPDGNFVCRSVEENCPAEMVEQILGHYDNLSATVFTESPSPRWSTWRFEQGQIRFVERADGWRLALIVRAESDAALALDALSAEFLTLSLEN